MGKTVATMVTIVKATPEHRSEVLRLVEQLLTELEDQPAEFSGIDLQKVRQDLEDVQDRYTAFLAQALDGECVGVITVMEAFAIYANGNYGIIDEMYVAPSYRSKGVGKQLIDAVKQHASARGWLRIDVTAPPEERWVRTVRFYEAQGFVFTGPKLRYMIEQKDAL